MAWYGSQREGEETYGRYSVINNVSNIHVYHSFTKFFAGSPFRVKITDRSRVSLMDNLTDQMDENGHLALVCNEKTKLHYDISDAGPGNAIISYLYDKSICLLFWLMNLLLQSWYEVGTQFVSFV